jgi:CBS domain-containing protein
VKEFMEAPPIVVSEDTTIDQAASTMWEKRIGSVIVVDKEGKMAGIITASDIIFAVTKSLVGRGVPVSSIMSKTSIMATPNESVLTAVERMMRDNVRHLPVIEKNGTPVGIISTKDVMGMSEPLLKFVFRSRKTATKKKKTPSKKTKA